MNDMRLIDADALLESAGIFEAIACARGCGKSIMSLAKTWLFNEVSKAPTIDAVPVVRCKDCKYVKFICDGRLVCGATTNPNWVCDEHFCSYGERKDGDGNG